MTSISADLRGFAAKGASAILYRNMSYLTRQFFVTTTAQREQGLDGSTAGGPSQRHGRRPGDGRGRLLSLARSAWETTTLRQGIALIQVSQKLPRHDRDLRQRQRPGRHLRRGGHRNKGWDVASASSERPPDGQRPPRRSSTSTRRPSPAVTADQGEPWLKRSNEAAMRGMMAKVPVRGLVKHSVRKVMENMYAAGGNADMANRSRR